MSFISRCASFIARGNILSTKKTAFVWWLKVVFKRNLKSYMKNSWFWTISEHIYILYHFDFVDIFPSTDVCSTLNIFSEYNSRNTCIITGNVTRGIFFFIWLNFCLFILSFPLFSVIFFMLYTFYLCYPFSNFCYFFSFLKRTVCPGSSDPFYIVS